MEEKQTKCDLLENQRQSADARNHYINNRRNLSSHNKRENKMSIVIQVCAGVGVYAVCTTQMGLMWSLPGCILTLKLQSAGV